jgi:hypothetical protein
MPRPRQNHWDCVFIVFRELTGDDEATAFGRFAKYLTGAPGITADALCACLYEAGWMVNKDYSRFPTDDAGFSAFWKSFVGEGALFYKVGEQEVGHAVVVRTGGRVFDPRVGSPEEGEFIVDHFKQFQGRPIAVGPFFVVTKPSN